MKILGFKKIKWKYLGEGSWASDCWEYQIFKDSLTKSYNATCDPMDKGSDEIFCNGTAKEAKDACQQHREHKMAEYLIVEDE